MSTTVTAPYRLVRAAPVAPPEPTITPAFARVLDHRAGAVLVLGGPGTGKSTVLVEAAARRIMAGESGRPLVLSFSRRAAHQMSGRIAARVGGVVESPLAMTLHSFCLAVVRRFTPESDMGELRLLTAPVQDARLRELLGGLPAEVWPQSLVRAVGTRGFASEVRTFLARVRQLGLDPGQVAAAGLAGDRPEWVTAGAFFEEYLDVLDAEFAIDYGELVHRARILLADPAVVATLRSEITSVFVDELQDLDAAQLGVVRDLVADGGHVVACGDPDQAVFGFRGAHPRAIGEFRRAFTVGADEPEIVVLDTGHRLPAKIQSALGEFAGRLPLPGLPAGVLAAFRAPAPAAPGGDLRVFTLATATAEASFLARELRAAHLLESVPWSELAVIVRAGRSTIPALRRALVAAGVPIEVAGDEIPLAAELAVRPLLLALAVVAGETAIDPDVAERLLVSPLAGLDAVALRAFGRQLREAERAELGSAVLPRSSGELLADALRAPERLAELGPEIVPPQVLRLAAVLASAQALVTAGATAGEVLWHVWQGTSWPAELEAAAEAGGEPGRRADRDLDAVCALFDVATASDVLVGERGLRSFLAEVAAQAIPADTLRESAVRGEAVRVLTVHRAKGLQWRRVFVAGVQEGTWPDLRSRDTLLQASALPTGAELGPDIGDRLAESRRLFYVACTRATEQTTITAVAGTDGEGDQPSRFLRELDVPQVEVAAAETVPLSLGGLAARLRRAAVDPASSAELRRAAAVRLARLADLRLPLAQAAVPAADPARWWGTLPLTGADLAAAGPAAGGAAAGAIGGAVSGDADVIRLGGSSLVDLLACPRRYYLSRVVRAETPRGSAASMGSVIHVLAQQAETAAIPAATLTDHLDHVWNQISFEAEWLSTSEKIEAESALIRLGTWQQAYGYREVLGVEVRFETELQVSGARVKLVGAVDRLEADGLGGLRIVDFKTGRSAPAKAEVATNEQLGVYQLAVQLGAFEQVAPGVRRAGGGELVYLRVAETNPDMPKTFEQPSLTDQPQPTADQPTWVHDRIARAVEIIRDGQYPATPNDMCRFCVFATSCPARGGKQVVR